MELRTLIGELFRHPLCKANFTKSNESTLREITPSDPLLIYVNSTSKHQLFSHMCTVCPLQKIWMHASQLGSSSRSASFFACFINFCDKASCISIRDASPKGQVAPSSPGSFKQRTMRFSHVDFWHPNVIETKWDFVGSCAYTLKKCCPCSLAVNSFLHCRFCWTFHLLTVSCKSLVRLQRCFKPSLS